MKQRIALLTVFTLLAIAAIAQNNKTAIVGTWKGIAVNDSIVQNKLNAILDTATEESTKTAVAFIGLTSEMLKDGVVGSTMVFDKKGGYRTKSIVLGESTLEEKGKYTFLEKDVIELKKEDDENDAMAYIILEMDAKRMVLMLDQINLIMTYERQ